MGNSHSTGSASSTRAPICMKTTFAVMPTNTNECTVGASELADAATCSLAADHLGLTYGSTGSWASVPKGCYVSDGKANFNVHTVGAPSSTRAPVCGIFED